MSDKERVMVAMSGGVDSTAAALLLPGSVGCTAVFHDGESAADAVRDAKIAALALSMEHCAVDLRAEFKKNVVDAFAAMYLAGRTPNPCVMCNRTVKLPLLIAEAERRGCGKLATGHYAQISYDNGAERWILQKGLDNSKDQSYFLYGLSQDVLSRTLFPLGAMTKSDARELLRGIDLPARDRPESQDVCFFNKGETLRGFLERYGIELRGGDYVDTSGNVLGRHSGVFAHTVGQRRGLGVSASSRLYVLGVDPASNRVVLGDESELMTRRIAVKDINFVSIPTAQDGLTATVKLRHTKREQACRVHLVGPDRAVVELSEPVRRPAAGQAAVFYGGDVVLFGGEITNDLEE